MRTEGVKWSFADRGFGFVAFRTRWALLVRRYAAANPLYPHCFYPACRYPPCFNSVKTCLAISFSVSNTPCP